LAKTAIVADPVFMKHDTGPGHPERSERLAAIGEILAERGIIDKVEKVPLREATAEELLRVHTNDHIKTVESTAGKDRTYLDGDTPASADSHKAALLAAGSLIDATEAVIGGHAKNAFAFIRPPGHHAEANRAMGFCLFNNVAVAARHAIARHKMSRVLIVDWDVHHGNSTQHVFYDDPKVLFFSIHHYPFYPGTGGVDETGSGDGKGYTVNTPVPGGVGDDLYDEAFARTLVPVARAFKPELIMVSAGFDAHCHDPLGGMEVTEECFARMAATVMELADEFCGGKVVATLEGGYDLDGLANSVADVTETLMGEKKPEKARIKGSPVYERIIAAQRECLADVWPGLGDEG